MRLLICVFSLLVSVSSQAAAVKTGDWAPDFMAQTSQKEGVSLKALLQKGPVVLIFFPKAGTAGCTQELKNFVANSDALTKLGATPLAVSGDSAEALEKFRQQLGAQFAFVPDPQGKLMTRFGTKMPLLNVSTRKTFVIDTLGRVAFVESGGDAIALTGTLRAVAALTTPAADGGQRAKQAPTNDGKSG